MNDRYLFRAKRIDNGEWIVGDLSHHKTGKVFIKPLNGSAISTCEVDKHTICQCTGLTDKNGNKIWENDVVGFWDTYSTENGYAEADCIGKVVWDDETLSFQVTERLSAESYEVLDECSVIGNIFDNPKLMYE